MTLSHRLNFMLKFIVTLVLLPCCLATSSIALAQYTDIKRLGTTQAICKKPGVQTRAELQAFFADNPTLISNLLEDAKWQGDKQSLLDAIAEGKFIEKQFSPGTEFEWMGMRKSGIPQTHSLRRWAGQKPFEGFEASVVQGCKSYRFVIPKICCNLALADTIIQRDEPSLNVFIEQSSMRICTEENVSLTLKNPDDTNTNLPLDQDQCWQGNDMPEGNYSINAAAKCGLTERSATIEKPEKLKLAPFIAAYLGTETVMRLETAWDMDMRDSSGIVGIRAGLKVPLDKTLFLVPSVGTIHRTGVNDGNEYPDDSINFDLGLEKFVTNNLYIGAGIGAWNASDSDFREASLFINAGGSITKSSEWFIEARSIDSDNPDGNDGFSDNRSFNAGLRLFIK